MSIVAERLNGSRCHLVWRWALSLLTVLDEVPAPLPKTGAQPPSFFGPLLLWPNVWMHQDADSYGGRPQPGGLSVKWGPSHPCRKRGRSPHYFSAHVYCGQTATWIKIPLGTEKGLGPDDSSPLPKNERSPLPNYRPMSIVAKELDGLRCRLVWM